MTENSETNLHHPADVSSESMGAEAVGYRTFPSVSQWAELSVSLRDVDNAHARMQEAKETVSTEALGSALEAVRRAAAVDTNAIEGIFPTDRSFTRTVAEQTGAWQQLMDQRGAHVRPAFEDTLAGFDFILDDTTGKYPLTETAIKELHAVMLNSQDEITVYVSVNGTLQAQQQKLPKGEYKKQPNSPTRHDGSTFYYAPVADTAPEMARFIAELNSETFAAMHPVVQAAYAHYAFVRIHPFADGNGRIARALASIFLYRSPGVPLVIYHDQRADYLDALEAADDGDFKRLVRFLAEKSVDTVLSITEDLREHASESYGQVDDGLAQLLNADAVPKDVREAATRLQELVRSALQSEIEKCSVKDQLQLEVFSFAYPQQHIVDSVEEPFTLLDGNLGLVISASTTKVKKERHYYWHVVALAVTDTNDESPATAADLRLRSVGGQDFDVFQRELIPAVSQSLRNRTQSYAKVVLREFLHHLKDLLFKEKIAPLKRSEHLSSRLGQSLNPAALTAVQRRRNCHCGDE